MLLVVHFYTAIAKHNPRVVLYSSFGVVYLAERRKDKKQVAIKCVSVGMDEDARRELKALRNEVQILRACNDPFVVKYHESFMVQKMRSEETWVSQTRVSLSLYLLRHLSSPLTKICRNDVMNRL